jgi:hypothetical protein
LISSSNNNDGRPDERQQLNERRFGQEWNRAEQGEPPPPTAWRWIQYDPSQTVSEPELKRRL